MTEIADDDKQAEDIADGVAYQELVVTVPPEVLQKIEERVETRWMNEFRVFAENAENRVTNVHHELIRWRYLTISLAKKANIGDPLSQKLMLPATGELETWEKEQFDALLEKMELYLRMGQDFETMIQAIQSNDAVQSCWERLMVAMRLAGLDEVPQE